MSSKHAIFEDFRMQYYCNIWEVSYLKHIKTLETKTNEYKLFHMRDTRTHFERIARVLNSELSHKCITNDKLNYLLCAP